MHISAIPSPHVADGVFFKSPGQSDIKPEVNAIQTLIAQKQKDAFRIAIFQNTPAAFHERPELKEKLTEELREILHAST